MAEAITLVEMVVEEGGQMVAMEEEVEVEVLSEEAEVEATIDVSLTGGEVEVGANFPTLSQTIGTNVVTVTVNGTCPTIGPSDGHLIITYLTAKSYSFVDHHCYTKAPSSKQSFSCRRSHLVRWKQSNRKHHF